MRTIAFTVALLLAARVARADEPAAAPAAAPSAPAVDDLARHHRRIIALIVGGIGVASIIVGAAHGIGATEDWHEVLDEHLCDSGHVCNPKGDFLTVRSGKLATAADIFVPSGIGVVAIGAVIWFTAPDVKVLGTSLRVTPSISPSSAGMLVEAYF